MFAIRSWSTAKVLNALSEGLSSYIHMMSQTTEYIKIPAKGEGDSRLLHTTSMNHLIYKDKNSSNALIGHALVKLLTGG